MEGQRIVFTYHKITSCGQTVLRPEGASKYWCFSIMQVSSVDLEKETHKKIWLEKYSPTSGKHGNRVSKYSRLQLYVGTRT